MHWKAYVQWAKDNGMDVCHLTLSLTDAFMKGVEGAAQVQTGKQVVNIQQNNVFQYQVQKPRREPYSLECVREEYQRTLSVVLFEAYVLNKARDMTREFSYLDFLELKRDAFRRIVLHLKHEGRIFANPHRTHPQFYLLAEKLCEELPVGKHYSKTNVYIPRTKAKKGKWSTKMGGSNR